MRIPASSVLLVAIIGVLVSMGFFVWRKRTIKELIYIEQERDNFRKLNADARRFGGGGASRQQDYARKS